MGGNATSYAEYSSKNIPQYPTCKHNSKQIECRTLNEKDIRSFHAAFYKNTKKLAQDAFLVNFCKASSVASHKDTARKKSLNIKYFSKNCLTGAMIPVCQKTFLGILNINKGRVQGVVKRFRSNAGKPPAERRGGNKTNINFIKKNASVIKFLNSLKGSEPYSFRIKTQKKIYLSADLNISKLWRMYNSSQNELKVKEKYFRDIFNTKFNISFKTPATDKCSTCSEYRERLNRLESKERKDVMILSRIHRLRYKAFYSIMQEDEANILTMSFDCQNSLSLPKLPDQIAYFSRQWSFYHFCIVIGNSKTILSPLNVNSYVWNDTERPKSSNEISSAVFHRLIDTDFGICVTKLRLVADGCGGQNKNTSLLCMLSKWLQEHSPPQIKIVEVLFPVVGHSFIPPNRVFGRIEKVIKCREVISDPDEYISILKQHGIVFDLGKDVPVFDWRKAANKYFKPLGNWHFRFEQTNRFFLTKTSTNEIQLQGEETYRAQLSTPQFVTKNKSCTSFISPESLPSRKVAINKNKLKDVNILLKKYYGENWRQLDTLKFYRDIEDLSEKF